MFPFTENNEGAVYGAFTSHKPGASYMFWSGFGVGQTVALFITRVMVAL